MKDTEWLILFLLLIGVYMLTNSTSSVVYRMAKAIQDWEDGVRDNMLTQGTIAGDNNNPGNLKPSGFTYKGQVGIDQYGHAIFDTKENGWNALINQLLMAFNNSSHVYNSQMNLYDFFDKYAEANSENYAEFIASQLGVSPNDTLEQIGKRG